MDKNKKQGRPWPSWAINLESGEYTINQLIDFTKEKRTTVHHFLKRNAKSIRYEQNGQQLIAFYKWEKRV